MLAPIIVFAYNRPWHVEQTLTALSKNVYADESVLYIYCDGPKPNASDEQKAKIAAVRQVVRKQQWCKEVHIVEAPENKGLANSIIAGVTNVINDFGRAIIVEDDLITSPYFLKYMNEALDYYEDRKGVFSIGGYNFPHDKVAIPQDYEWSTYVSLRVCTWGWATWSDRWEQVDWSLNAASSLIGREWLTKSFNHAGDDMYNWFLLQKESKIDSWGIRFAYAQFANHAVTIMPCTTFVSNIGFDGTGVHCSSSIVSQDSFLDEYHCSFVEAIYEDERIINSFYSHLSHVKRPLWQKACNYISRKLGKKPPFVIKKKVYA